MSGKYQCRTTDPKFAFAQSLQHGWLLNYLLQLDAMFWGRWDYWCATAEAKKLLAEPIPQIEWECTGSSLSRTSRKFLEAALDCISPNQHWNSWGSWQNFEYLMDWLLFGFGHSGHKREPREPCEGASARLYQVFDLGPLLLAPADHLGDLLAENAHGRHLGFYPTPMNLCHLMAKMLMDDEADHRLAKTCDPCVGTGRMLLAASNHSLCLFGQDINPIVIKATLVNGYLYAPWLVKPLGFLDEQVQCYDRPEFSPALSDALVQTALNDPKAAAYTDWLLTEHDMETQPAVHPLKIRRKRKPATAPLYEQPELMLT